MFAISKEANYYIKFDKIYFEYLIKTTLCFFRIINFYFFLYLFKTAKSTVSKMIYIFRKKCVKEIVIKKKKKILNMTYNVLLFIAKVFESVINQDRE